MNFIILKTANTCLAALSRYERRSNVEKVLYRLPLVVRERPTTADTPYHQTCPQSARTLLTQNMEVEIIRPPRRASRSK